MPKLTVVSNPPNPWDRNHVDWLGEPPAARLDTFEEQARTVLSRNDSPDLPFRWSVNPYRGCLHGCAYCYARPTHQYLGFGAGTDFERKLVVKVNAPEVLHGEFSRRSWKREVVVFSGITDCYQPLEQSYELTRRCLEVCANHRTPVVIITKGALVRRDVDLLLRLGEVAAATVHVSIPFASDDVARRLEPYASAPAARFETLRLLSAAGVRTGVSVSPLILGLNDAEVPEILTRARQAGATRAFSTLLRLPGEVATVFAERIRETLPERASRVLAAIAAERGGELNDARFGARMRGRSPRWEAAERLFSVTCRRLGLEHGEGPALVVPGPSPEAPSATPAQGELFPSAGAAQPTRGRQPLAARSTKSSRS